MSNKKDKDSFIEELGKDAVRAAKYEVKSTVHREVRQGVRSVIKSIFKK